MKLFYVPVLVCVDVAWLILMIIIALSHYFLSLVELVGSPLFSFSAPVYTFSAVEKSQLLPPGVMFLMSVTRVVYVVAGN